MTSQEERNTIDKVTAAVENFNSSSWVDLGEKYDVLDEIKRAMEVGLEQVLEEIRREDIRLFHTEEALCGNI